MGWPLREKDLKKYPHFDAPISLGELTRVATDPKEVARNSFFPFLLYEKRWKPFRASGKPQKVKRRPIRYASRKDSAIFSYYRYLLSQQYEFELERIGISDCPIAYRKMRAANSERGKCNIDFAAEAFAHIQKIGACAVATLDIKSFFECIDHQQLKSVWMRLLKVDRLPADHFAVYRAITKHAVVDRDAAYERLGFIGKKLRPSGLETPGFLVTFRNMPTQLCTPDVFRDRIAGGDPAFGSLILKNPDSFGIPQGAPISDLLANIYLIDFDLAVSNYVREKHGVYFRYSDDIFILIPGDREGAVKAADFASAELKKYGPQLEIKDSKTRIVAFSPGVNSLEVSCAQTGKPIHGLDYLGFRFDGEGAYIREATMSKFHRGIVLAARRRANCLARRFSDKDFDFLWKKFAVSEFEEKFGRVAEFEKSLGYRRWTFRTYIKRCAASFPSNKDRFFRQMRDHRQFIRRVAQEEIGRALAKPKSKLISLT